MARLRLRTWAFCGAILTGCMKQAPPPPTVAVAPPAAKRRSEPTAAEKSVHKTARGVKKDDIDTRIVAQVRIDLDAYYKDRKLPDALTKACRDLDADGARIRKVSGSYLLAMLQQLLADEVSGMSPVDSTPFWGESGVSVARELRKQVAKKLYAGRGPVETMPAALWLIHDEPLAELEVQGVKILGAIDNPRRQQELRRILAAPHSNADVLHRALETVRFYRFKDAAAEVSTLCLHHRRAIRELAGEVAVVLDAQVPQQPPAGRSIPISVQGMLRDVAAMVLLKVPVEAKWNRIAMLPLPEGYYGPADSGGWLLQEVDGGWQILDWFGQVRVVKKEEARLEPVELADDVKRLDPSQSRDGAFTGQFEPGFVSAPQALVSAWLFERGQAEVAAGILLPLLENIPDDRWFLWAVRDLLGHAYHQQMLDAFTHRRDYSEATRIARHLSQDVFDGYEYRDRCQKLAEELGNRGDDFTTLALPTQAEWQELQAKLDRENQIRYLAERLRLLNCIQTKQPGSISYVADQFREALYREDGRNRDSVQVVNPYTELVKTLQISDVPLLIPYLNDERFIVAYSYWRDFHPSRSLHQVNWVAAAIVNEVAGHELISLQELQCRRGAARQEYCDRLVTWCDSHSKAARSEVLAEAIQAAGDDPRKLYSLVDKAVESKDAELAPLLAKQVPRHADQAFLQERLAEACFLLDSPKVLDDARKWVDEGPPGVRVRGAEIVLRHGDESAKGLDLLQRVLKEIGQAHYFCLALPMLLDRKEPRALDIGCGLFASGVKLELTDTDIDIAARQLLLRGRREALDFAIASLDSTIDGGLVSGVWNGEEVERPITHGDYWAESVLRWRADPPLLEYDRLAPDDQRAAWRDSLKKWLTEQFEQVQAGMPTEIDPSAYWSYGAAGIVDSP